MRCKRCKNGNHTDSSNAANGTDGFATTPALAAVNEYSSYTAPGTTTALSLSYNPRGDLTCDGKFNCVRSVNVRGTDTEICCSATRPASGPAKLGGARIKWNAYYAFASHGRDRAETTQLIA